MSLPERLLERGLHLIGLKADWIHLHAKQGIKFCTVGLFNTFLDLGLLALFVEVVHLELRISVVMSAGIAMTSAFIINKFWTFRDAKKTYLSQYIVFLSVYISSLFIGVTITIFCAETLGIYYLLARLVALPVTTAWNYLWSHFRVFR